MKALCDMMHGVEGRKQKQTAAKERVHVGNQKRTDKKESIDLCYRSEGS